MRKEGAIVDDTTARRKPCELTDQEVFLLMQAYTADKSCITEADALTLCHWAQAQKLGAYVLRLVLEGHLRVTVEGDAVKLNQSA
jgi:hypothetical protein